MTRVYHSLDEWLHDSWVVPKTERIIRVLTSCGREFSIPIIEIPDHKLRSLLQQNGDRTDVDPLDLAAMRDELKRREDSIG
jgi:hypothetical protein